MENNNSTYVGAQTGMNTASPVEEDNGIQIIEIFWLFLKKWYWFVLSAGLFVAAARFYLQRQIPVYTRTATVQIKEDDNKRGGLASQFAAGADLGMFGNASSVQNEVIAFQSPALMSEVISRLKLDVSYMTDGDHHLEPLYGKNQPVQVEFLDLKPDADVTIEIKLTGAGGWIMQKYTFKGIEHVVNVKGKFGEEVRTQVGHVRVTPNPTFHGKITGKKKNSTIYVTRLSMEKAISSVMKNFTAALNDKQSQVINLTYTDIDIPRAEDMLNTVIDIYNEKWIKDKNQIANSTSEFIDDRLKVLEQELDSVDSNISKYKSDNLMVDAMTSGRIYMQNTTEAKKASIELTNQLEMAKYVRDFIANELDKNTLLPVNTGMGSSGIESQIQEYNKLVLERNQYEQLSTPQNPIVLDYDEHIASLRPAILASIENQITNLNAQLASSENTEEVATEKLAKSPILDKGLLSAERQQKVKESLYLYLLQKREENQLSKAFTAYNTRIITPAWGTRQPISPNKRNIYLIALVLGLALPGALIYLVKMNDTTIRGKIDLERMTAPYLGEIPMVKTKKRKNAKKGDRRDDFVVRSGRRDVINEAFRVVRANIEFITGADKKVIMITSANPGSGKTFFSVNLASAFAIKKKRVLVIDLDLRKASFSRYVDRPRQGISTYLAGHTDTYRDLIKEMMPGLDVLPCGKMPPNPAELLYEDRLKQVIDEMREEYDYILLDCPPVEIVADANIIAPLADNTLFLVRAGLLQRDMLPEIDKMYETKKFGNMSIILNATTEASGKYGYRKYGYRYGYKYGYGKGYYSNSDDDDDDE